MAMSGRERQGGYLPLGQAMQRLLQDSVLLPSSFQGGAGAGAPPTNLWETPEGYVVQLALPGLRPDSLQLTVEQRVLAVRGESALRAPERGTPLWQSFAPDPAACAVQLPGEVDAGGAEASYEAGVLTVRLPKAAHMRPRTIQVTAR